MRTIHLVGGLCLANMALQTPVSAQHLTATQVESISPPAGHAQRLVGALNRLEPATQVAGRTYSPQSIEQVMAQFKVPAVSLAVVSDGKVVWAKAYGKADPASAQSANPGTVFQAASISKPVAAMGALTLVEAGKLQLDSPANRSLISWHIADTDVARGDAVTLRHLLTHTAGLTVHGFPGYAEGKSLPTTLQVLNGAAPANTDRVRIAKAPGSEWKYSGGGYTVLEQLMTEVTGEPFPQLMHRLVLKPAGMLSSSYGAALPSHENNLAVGHLSDGTPVVGRHHSYAELAAAGLWTNPTDLASWLINLSAAFRGAQGQVLKPALARSMLTPGRGDWGLGLPVRGDGDALNFSHGGANEGFRAFMLAYPNRRDGFVMMTNSNNGSRLSEPLRIAIGKALGWSDAKPKLIEPRVITRRGLAQLIGRYVGASATLDVKVETGRLMATQIGSGTFELVPLMTNGFVIPDRGIELDFSRDRSGRVTGLRVGGVTLKRAR